MERGAGLLSTAAGVVVFLVFLLFAVQLLFGLYASSTVTAVAHDAAHRAAAQGAPPRGFIEADARRNLGDVGESAEFRWGEDDSDGDGEVDTVVSDHACCMEEMKEGDTWSALPGFGGTSLIYPVLLSEGVHKRGLPLSRAAELASTNPAQRYGVFPRKGAIAVGSDADLAIVDLNETRTVSVSGLHSAQDHTPFAGMALRGWPVATVLRGFAAAPRWSMAIVGCSPSIRSTSGRSICSKNCRE